MKKMTILLVVFLLNIVPINVLAKENDTAEIRKQITSMYQNDPEYQRNLAEDPDSAKELLENAVSKEIALSLMLRSGDQSNAFCTVPDVWQLPNQCGAASAYQAIAGAGYTQNINGNSESLKIAQLWSEVNENNQSSVVYKIVNSLNRYIPNGGYTYAAGAGHDVSWFETRTAASLVSNHPVILHALTEHIQYYGGHSSRHYICVSRCNRNNGTVTAVDCNNNSKYHGTHTISSGEAYKSISASGRYLIYG